MIRHQAWRAEAACVGQPPDLWIPGVGAGNSQASDEAVAICRSCPVATQCAEHALTQPEHYGIWGGTTQEERKNVLGMVRCGTTAGFARHRRNGSEPCRSCRDATNSYKRRMAAQASGQA